MGGKARAPNKEVRELIRKVEKQGCEVEKLGSGHFRVSRTGRDGVVTISGTEVSYGAWQRNLKLLRSLLSVEV
jgi:hypothetical protein